jgi:hypothetical protein
VTENNGVQKDRQRSPGYPTIPLEDAIAKARIFYLADKGSAATPEVLAHHWKSSTKSSAFLQWMPSLKRFGLLDELPGKVRQLKLTKLAMDILLLPEGDAQRLEAIKQSALMPVPFRELWEQHGINLPSNQNLQHYLVTTKNFRPDAATDLIRQYKRTIEFAKLSEGDKIGEGDVVENHPIGAVGQPDVSGAVDLFRGTFLSPQRRHAIESMEQSRKTTPMQSDVKQDTFTLAEGQVVFQWPSHLSAESFEDLKDWLELQMRKIGRSVGRESESAETPKAN